MECIVHFEVIHHTTNTVTKLRGLVITDKHEQPSIEDIKNMLHSMGYDVHCLDKDKFIFKPNDATTDVKEICIKKIDCGEETYIPDPHLQRIANHLMPKSHHL